MAKVQPGRYTARIDGDFVVFVIGMRFNKPWKVWKWGPVFMAMAPMLRELAKHPEKGMLGVRTAFAGRTVTLIQFWRSFEQLEAFARGPEDPHLPAWRRFNKAVGNGGDVGIYHETFKVAAGQYECVYGNMPVFGLAATRDAAHVAVGRGTDAARERIGASAA